MYHRKPLGTEVSPLTEYVISSDLKYNPLELIDVATLAGACRHDWFNQALCQVNDCVVRLGVLKGEFHWHKHELEDEFFFVVDGRLTVDLDNRNFELGPAQGVMVPRGVMHRTRAAVRTVALMVEGTTVKPTGD